MFENQLEDASDVRRLSIAGFLITAWTCHGISLARATDWTTETEWPKQPVVVQNVSADLLRRPTGFDKDRSGFEALKKLNVEVERFKNEFWNERSASDHGSRTLSEVLRPLEALADNRSDGIPKNFDRKSRRLAARLKTVFQLAEDVAKADHVSPREVAYLEESISLSSYSDFIFCESVRQFRMRNYKSGVTILRNATAIATKLVLTRNRDLMQAGKNLRSSANTTITKISRICDLPKSVRFELLAILIESRPRIEECEWYLRNTFQMQLRELRKLPDTRNLDLTIASACFGNWARTIKLLADCKGLQNWNRFVLDIHDVLRDHPEPFDLAETLQLVSRIGEEWILNLRSLDASLQDENFRALKRDLAPWPDSLRFDSFSHIQRVMSGDFEHPGKIEIHLARCQLATVKNPFGKALLVDLLEWEPAFARKFYQVALAHNELSTTVVALNIYEARHGHLPQTLQSLIDEKIIEAMPVDPFGGNLKYSRKRSLLWSNWTDGVDHGGVDARKFPQRDFELLKTFETFIPVDRRIPLPPPVPEDIVPGVDNVRDIRLRIMPS